MNDTKNILLAWISSLSSVWTALESRTLVTVVSAIVLPIVFFILGKAKTQKRSTLGRIGDILIGAAIFAVLK